MTKKKIVVFTTSYFPFVGGAEIAIREVARRLCDSYDFIIITSRQKRGLAVKEIVPEGIILRVGFGGALDKWIFPLAGFFVLCKLAVAGHIPKPWSHVSRHNLLIWGIDISQGSLAACVIKVFFPGIAFVFTIQYGNDERLLDTGRMGAVAMAFRRMLASADGVTAISSYLFRAAQIRGFAGFGKIIPNGVDTSVFAFHQLKHHEKDMRRVVITTSRLEHKNGIDVLIRSIAEVKKIWPQIACYILGEGSEKESLRRLVKELTLEREINFLGTIAYGGIPFYLMKADVFARPSRSEGMGNSFVEALAAGVPIIGTSVGGIPDIINEGRTGLFCKVDDAHDLAQKILLLLDNNDLASRIGENGRRLVEEKFSWSAIAQSYNNIFEHLLNARKRVLIATPLYPPEIGGPATYAHILTTYLLGEGISARVLCFNSVRTLPKVIRHIAYFFKMLMRARGCDYLFALDPVSVGFPAACAAFVLHKPLVIKIVGDYAWEQGVQRFGVSELLDDFLKKSYGWRIECLRKIQYFTARRARGIIVPSEYLKKVVMAWGIDADKITVIANAEEIETIFASHEDLRKMLSFSGTVLFSAGRLVPWKGFKLLIELMPELLRDHSDITLFIAGSGPQKNELESMITAYGLHDRVRLLGSLAHVDILRCIKAADVFVLASSYEGLSHVILEAMAMGAIIVASNVGGNPELVEHGKNGFLFDLNDREHIIRTIQTALALTQDQKIVISRAATANASGYTPEYMTEKTSHYFLNL